MGGNRGRGGRWEHEGRAKCMSVREGKFPSRTCNWYARERGIFPLAPYGGARGENPLSHMHLPCAREGNFPSRTTRRFACKSSISTFSFSHLPLPSPSYSSPRRPLLAAPPDTVSRLSFASPQSPRRELSNWLTHGLRHPYLAHGYAHRPSNVGPVVTNRSLFPQDLVICALCTRDVGVEGHFFFQRKRL